MFGEMLRRPRLLRRLSLAGVAELVGVAPSTVDDWEKGVSLPREDKLERIAAALELDENELRRAWHEAGAQRRADATRKGFEEFMSKFDEVARESRQAPHDRRYQLLKRVDWNDLRRRGRRFEQLFREALASAERSESAKKKTKKKRATRKAAGGRTKKR